MGKKHKQRLQVLGLLQAVEEAAVELNNSTETMASAADLFERIAGIATKTLAYGDHDDFLDSMQQIADLAMGVSE